MSSHPVAIATLERELSVIPTDPDWTRRATAGAQLVEALFLLHRGGAVHGNLNPATVRRFSDGCLGLAAPDTKASTSSARPSAAARGYLPPECVLGAGAHQGADIWALGVLLYQVFFRVSPRWIRRRGRLELVTLSGPRTSLGVELERLCAACLAYVPADRPTVARVRRRLRRALDPYGLEVVSFGGTREIQSPFRGAKVAVIRWTWWYVFASFLRRLWCAMRSHARRE